MCIIVEEPFVFRPKIGDGIYWTNDLIKRETDDIHFELPDVRISTKIYFLEVR